MEDNIMDGSIYFVLFGETFPNEINNYHPGIIFNVYGVRNMVFCVPITSPKPKHFLNIRDYENRNSSNLKFSTNYYIKRTDSIAAFDQVRMISVTRLRRCLNILTEEELIELKFQLIKFLEKILYKKQ